MKRMLMASLVLGFAASSAMAADGKAVIEKSEGQVEVIRMLKRLPAQKGMELMQKDIISAGEASAASVALPDGTTVEVGAKSRLKMTNYLPDDAGAPRHTLLELLNGAGAFNVRPLPPQDSFEVKSPVAVVGVRGTRFIVVHQVSRRFGVQSSVAVVNGSVQVKSVRFASMPGVSAVVVQPLQKTEVSAEAPPTVPVTLPLSEIRVMAAQAGLSSTAESREMQPAALDGQQPAEPRIPQTPEGVRAQLQDSFREALQEVQAQIQQQAIQIIQERIAVDNQKKVIGRPVAPPPVP